MAARMKLWTLLCACLLVIAVFVVGCGKPMIVKFNVGIPSNATAPTGDVSSQQGVTHVCPGTSVDLSWTVKGHAELSASPGKRYQPPACFTIPNPGGTGTKEIPNKNTQIAGTCSDDATFRLTAAHTLWRRAGSCPGEGCPNADREIKLASSLTERVGNNITDCTNDTYEVTNNRPAVDWDDQYSVGSVSVSSGITTALEQTPGRTLILLHNAKEARFSAGKVTSDAFSGEKFSGAWVLRLSGCASPPPALIVNVQAGCSK